MNQALPSRVDNRRQMGWSPSSWLIMSAAFVLLGTAGVVLRPALTYRAALDERSLAEEELGTLSRLQTSLEALESQQDTAVLEQVSALLHGLIPRRPDKVELYGDLRAAANLSGTQLTTLAFQQDERALGPGGSGEWVYLIGAELSGEARPDALARLVQLIRASGRPTLINRFSLQRSDYSEPVFHFAIQVGFPFYGPAPELDGEDPMAALPR